MRGENIKQPYVVVQDLSPFAINFVSQHWTEFGARLEVGSSRYLKVMKTRDALERDLQLIEDAEAKYGIA